MKEAHSWKQKLKLFMFILYPILITQVAFCAFNFFDTTMSGHAGRNDLAGVAIGSNLWMPVFTAINGILMAITPNLAQLHGAKKQAQVPYMVIQGLYLALFLGMATIVGGALVLSPVLFLLNLEAEVYRIAYGFLAAISLGVIPFFVNMVLRSFIDTLGYTRVSMFISVSALPVNILLNYAFIFGKMGLPAFGGIGAGYASALTYWFMAVVSAMVIHFLPPFKEYRIFGAKHSLSVSTLKDLLYIGIPIGFAIFCETSIFGVVALLMAKFGTITIAAHQAAINFASLVYMLPLSISMTLTIIVGFEVGAGRLTDARRYGLLGIVTAVCLSVMSALGLIFYNHQVAAFYSDSAEVLPLIEAFLIYAAFFQLSDAVAAPIQGILRGYKDVKVTFIMALVSYWLIGLPVGYLLANYTAQGAFGYWIGFITGLAAGAVGLALRLCYVQRMAAKLSSV
ncbi:putative multidrug resistance protein NorM [Propionispora sp. 2/2-37]|uniref:MATE family efflux transporter n=1 Tax=Propionispora sp. 2/2-37 TaxID=1677858 RepID=UPI0006BB72E4|nr:MATE family efflux transporter [Propionispora sp. 2/2-37]CUH96058.1 putative multidrug resistance protein NorM [Propionispora sp. 2/2-37]